MSDTAVNENRYAPTVWGIETFNDLECPSGQMCQVRQPGMQAMIAGGVLESADTLTTLVDEKHIKRVQGKTTVQNKGGGKVSATTSAPKANEIDTETLMKDPENMTRVFQVVDRVVEHMVVQPDVKRAIRVAPHPDDATKTIELPLTADERVDGVIYADMVDLMDKMYIFQYAVGGSTDVESFREQFTEGVGGVAVK